MTNGAFINPSVMATGFHHFTRVYAVTVLLYTIYSFQARAYPVHSYARHTKRCTLPKYVFSDVDHQHLRLLYLQG